MGFGYSATSWASWPSCNHPRTLSFRSDGEEYRERSYMINNPLWFDEEEMETADVILEENEEEDATMESVVRSVRRTAESSGRLFFEPAGESSSILLKSAEEQGNHDQKGSFLVNQHKGTGETVAAPSKVGGVAVKVKSADPYADFRASMQEMIVAHGWMGWDWLQDMLEWYLQANSVGASIGKCSGHSDTILQAFVDMIMEQVFSIPSSDAANSDGWASHSPSSSSSSSSSSFSM